MRDSIFLNGIQAALDSYNDAKKECKDLSRWRMVFILREGLIIKLKSPYYIEFYKDVNNGMGVWAYPCCVFYNNTELAMNTANFDPSEVVAILREED